MLLMMTSTEKILAVMDLIRDFSEITPKPSSAIINEDKFVARGLETDEVETIMHKLEDEKKCITIWNWPGVRPNFDEDAKRYVEEHKQNDLALVSRIVNSLELHYEPEYDYHVDMIIPTFQDVYDKYKSGSAISIRLEPKSYNAADTILSLGHSQLLIAKQASRRGPHSEPRQARLMRLLFNDVNSMKVGVPIRRILSVRDADLTASRRKLIKNTVAEINKKASAILGDNQPPLLIIHNKNVVKVNETYL
jgi:hypothetical protein